MLFCSRRLPSSNKNKQGIHVYIFNVHVSYYLLKFVLLRNYPTLPRNTDNRQALIHVTLTLFKHLRTVLNILIPPKTLLLIFLHYDFIGHCNVYHCHFDWPLLSVVCTYNYLYNNYLLVFCSVDGRDRLTVCGAIDDPGQLLYSLHNILLLVWCVGYTFPWQLHEHGQ